MSKFVHKVTSLIVLGTGGALAFGGFAIVVGNEQFYKNILMPAVHKVMEPEAAHVFAIKAAKWGLFPRGEKEASSVLRTRVFGIEFKNPVGLAAGFDKNGEAFSNLGKSGFGFVEIGSVTPLPQPGNPQPRVFRLIEDRGVINRYGFNSIGHDAVFELVKNKASKDTLGVNLGKNKLSEDPASDFVLGVRRFGEIADYLVVNISSPNTPGLRSLQRQKHLEDLLDKVLQVRDELNKKTPVLVKIAPDLTLEEKKDIASVVLRPKKRIDGIIISNTTISRPSSLKSSYRNETGGLSGEPLKNLATETIGDMYKLTQGKIPIVGVGGIASGADAYEKIKAGASLVQLYSALVYKGPPVVKQVKRELEELLKKDGYQNISEAVGTTHRNVEEVNVARQAAV